MKRMARLHVDGEKSGRTRPFSYFCIPTAVALGAVLVTPAVGGAAWAAPEAGTQASGSKLVAMASAYGSKLSHSALLASGATAPVALGNCASSSSGPITRTAVGVDLPGVATSGLITDTAEASVTGAKHVSQASSVVEGADLLGGLVTATSVSSSSVSTLKGGVYGSTGVVDLADLVVAGQPVAASPAPNTTLALPGVGTITLNKESAQAASLTVDAISVKVLRTNALGLAVGAVLTLGHSVSGFASSTPVVALVAGRAYGTRVMLASTVTSSETAPESLGCLGSGGATRMTTVSGVTVPGVVSSGTITSTAEGDTSSTRAHALTTDTIQDAHVLASLISASSIKASAEATDASGQISTDDTGSAFVGLQVAGFPLLGDNVPANTVLTIPGVGTLYLDRVITTAKSIEVRMIELVVTSPTAAVPAGTDIRVAVASASIKG